MLGPAMRSRPISGVTMISIASSVAVIRKARSEAVGSHLEIVENPSYKNVCKLTY
jgi:hypothetical protein